MDPLSALAAANVPTQEDALADLTKSNPLPPEKAPGGDGGPEIARPSGAIYQGVIDVKGRAHGHGTQRWPNGDVYVGEWVADAMEGYGTFETSSGSSYRGRWEASVQWGQGTYLAPDGGKYTGEWQDGQMHGEGEYTWPDGAIFQGQFVQGKRTGHGVITWESGVCYDGEWLDDVEHGNGMLMSQDGVTIEGKWIHGEQVSEGEDGNGAGSSPGIHINLRQEQINRSRSCAGRCSADCTIS